ncbi:MAG: hypothetical protein TU36_001225 [Vulcanisaeta sp. AZ3]|jgi:7-cyano-7-deazaguanine reductase
MITVVIAKPVNNVEIESRFTAVCPVDNSIDDYTIRITYRPRCNDKNCVYLELGSLKDYLDGFKGRVIYHEDLINEIMNEVIKSIRPIEIMIELISSYRGIKYILEKRVIEENYQYES